MLTFPDIVGPVRPATHINRHPLPLRMASGFERVLAHQRTLGYAPAGVDIIGVLNSGRELAQAASAILSQGALAIDVRTLLLYPTAHRHRIPSYLREGIAWGRVPAGTSQDEFVESPALRLHDTADPRRIAILVDDYCSDGDTREGCIADLVRLSYDPMRIYHFAPNPIGGVTHASGPRVATDIVPAAYSRSEMRMMLRSAARNPNLLQRLLV